MRIIIDIPEQFESDYKGDMFKDFFSRVLCDIQDGTLCGNYEKETAEMFLKAFDESSPMDRIVEELEEYKNWYISHGCNEDLNRGIIGATNHAIEIVKGGGNADIYGAGYKLGYEDGYNIAIDDTQKHISALYKDCLNGTAGDDVLAWNKALDKVIEVIKAGGNNDNR